MPNITSITSVESFFLREIPSHTKLTAQLTNKINTLIANQVIINSALNQLLQGATAGAEQAHLLMYMASAPTGWTQVTTHNDRVIRVVNDGTGTATSGAWTVSGISSGMESAHTHGLSNHTHDTTTSSQSTATTSTDGFHQHDMSGHTHTITTNTDGTHTHTVGNHTHTISSDGSGSTSAATSGGRIVGAAGSGPYADGYYMDDAGDPGILKGVSQHTHTGASHNHSGSTGAATASTNTDGAHAHSGTTAAPNTNLTGYDGFHNHTLNHTHGGTSGGPSNNTSETGTAHNHTITQDGTWRPAYVNVIIAKKD